MERTALIGGPEIEAPNLLEKNKSGFPPKSCGNISISHTFATDIMYRGEIKL